MRAFKATLSVLFFALFLGVGSAVLVIEVGAMGHDVRIGPWQANTRVGSTEAGLYTRAVIARAAMLALNRSESLYFIATEDSNGKPLTSSCTYQVVGADLPARWWSITVYGPDYFLIPNPDHRYAFSKSDMAAAGESTIQIALAPTSAAPALYQVPALVSGAGPNEVFSVLLRLYHPTPAAQARPADIAMPAIINEGCG